MKISSFFILLFCSTLYCYSQIASDYYKNGRLKASSRNYRGAIEDFNKCIKLDPTFAKAYNDRGLAKAELQIYHGAIEDYSKAIEIDPIYTTAYINRGKAKIALGENEDGCLDLSKAGELGDKNALGISEEHCNHSSNYGKKNINDAKVYYRDGKTVQYYVHHGISITMTLEVDREYGKYYVAYIAIENFTGSPFNFYPDDIKALLATGTAIEDGKVFSNLEYIKKVDAQQTWSRIFYAFGEATAASQAGYSLSSTNSVTSGYSNTYFNANGYYGNNYGSVNGVVNTYGSSNTNSSTQSYNGAAQYAAQQNANNNINNFTNQQYQIRNQLNQGYLKLNTINNEERITGQINVKYKKADTIKIIVPVNNENYEFSWRFTKP